MTLHVDTRLPTTFARLMAMNEMNLPKSATAMDDSKDIEIVDDARSERLDGWQQDYDLCKSPRTTL